MLSQNKRILIIGILVVVAPFTFFPQFMLNIFYVLAGASLITMYVIQLQKTRKANGGHGMRTDHSSKVFVENNPETRKENIDTKSEDISEDILNLENSIEQNISNHNEQ